MALYVGLDVSLKTTSICVVEADGTPVWEGKAESEPVPLLKALSRWQTKIALVGIEACPLSEWLYGALVESGLHAVCIETRPAQRFLSSRPNKTDRLASFTPQALTTDHFWKSANANWPPHTARVSSTCPSIC